MAERKKRYRGAIAVEAGGMLVPNPDFLTEPEAKIEARATVYFKSLAAMGYVGLNVGAHELALSPDTLKKLGRRHKLEVLSANIVDDKSGKAVFTPWIVRNVGGLKVGIFGLVSESPPNYGKLFLERGLRIVASVQAARKAVTALQGAGAELIVVVSQLRRTEIEDLGANVDGLHLVIGSSGMQLSMQVERLEKALFADTYIKGKYVGELLIHPGKDRTAYAVGDLRATMAAERAVAAQQVQAMAAEVEAADKPDSGLNLTEETKTMLRQRLVLERAKLQRLTMAMEDAPKDNAEAGTVELGMHPLGSEIQDDKHIVAIVDAYKKKFPAPAGADRH